MQPGSPLGAAYQASVHREQIERAKASVRAKVEYPFRVLKWQFCYTEVRYRRLAKTTPQIVTHFALFNLWMEPQRLIG